MLLLSMGCHSLELLFESMCRIRCVCIVCVCVCVYENIQEQVRNPSDSHVLLFFNKIMKTFAIDLSLFVPKLRVY